MLRGGFKKRAESVDAVANGDADMVGMGRAIVHNPMLADTWLKKDGGDPAFPKFESPIPGGITAWHTMQLTALAKGRENEFALGLASAIDIYDERDAQRCITWKKKFSNWYAQQH